MIPIGKINYDKKCNYWSTAAGERKHLSEISDAHLANILIEGYRNHGLLLEAYQRGWEPSLNIGQCTRCDDVVMSTYRHELAYCSCGKSFLDGGDNYQRGGGSIKIINEKWDTEKFKITLINKSDKYEKTSDCKGY